MLGLNDDVKYSGDEHPLFLSRLPKLVFHHSLSWIMWTLSVVWLNMGLEVPILPATGHNKNKIFLSRSKSKIWLLLNIPPLLILHVLSSFYCNLMSDSIFFIGIECSHTKIKFETCYKEFPPYIWVPRATSSGIVLLCNSHCDEFTILNL